MKPMTQYVVQGKYKQMLIVSVVNLYHNYNGTTKSLCANASFCPSAAAALGDFMWWPWQLHGALPFSQFREGYPLYRGADAAIFQETSRRGTDRTERQRETDEAVMPQLVSYSVQMP
ncbi:hypothetical protein KIN20_030341 [Parelaphostrongylus tenuis]|uniref:Uncharacterized protein n=1 Tax=Parelaphostrongylus tenuis TaxID=148309 RepID=A0AAD5WG27_PARTN|nr:hypothetical protein KIN20_030341 [Parelaphostrongylus tenuis]